MTLVRLLKETRRRGARLPAGALVHLSAKRAARMVEEGAAVPAASDPVVERR